MSPFMQIVWGLIVIVVDIKIGVVDLFLPDIAGYVLIYMALQKLHAEDESFRKADGFAIAGGITWFLTMLPIEPIQPFGMLLMFLDVILIWHICSGVIRMAEVRGNAGLSRAAANGRILNLIGGMIGFSSAGLMGIIRDFPALLVIPVVAFNIVVMVIIMILLRRAALETV